MSISELFKTREGRLGFIGISLSITAMTMSFYWGVEHWQSIPAWFYRHAEIIGLISPLHMFLFYLVIDRFGLSTAPNDSWWKCIVIPALGPLFAAFFIFGVIGLLFVLPLIVPIKMILAYALGPSANLGSALIALLVTILTVSFAFAVGYMTSILSSKGALVDKDGLELKGRESDWFKCFRESMYFSLATILGSSHARFEPQGWCRWIVLVELTVTKIIEIVIISVGIGIIVSRWSI